MKNVCLFVAAIFSMAPAFALVRLPAVISSNMILQQQSGSKLWGWCDPGEKISVKASWNNRVDSAKGTRDGNWMVEIPTPAAGGPYTVTIQGQNTIVLENVLIGEVWVCSGQSNMEMSGSWGLPDVRAELPQCYTNDIHFFHIPRTTARSPQDDCKGEWTLCDSNTLKNFSAAAYFFGKKLNAGLHVPVGLIEVAWGGTPAEVWTPEGSVAGDSLLQQAAAKQQPSDWWPYLPGYCYNGMIAPVTSYNIAGAIWYQGEGNTVAPQTYGRLFRTMIGSWRKAWNKDLPFYYVQIAPFTYGTKDQGSLLREQQAQAMSLGNTGMVVISDITGDTADIHPKDKHDVGLRLANWALAETYHQPGIVYRSPAYRDMQVTGNKVVVNIADASDDLIVKGGPVRTMVIAGEDRIFYPAEVRVAGGRLIVWSKQVKAPVAVRYQFSNAGVGNIFGASGLPLAPFRTDDWVVGQ